VAKVADLFDLGARQSERTNVPKCEVVFRPVRLELVTLAETQKGLAERLGVLDHLGRVLLELGRSGLFERHSDGGDRLIVRTSLGGGEDGVVDTLLQLRLLVLAEKDEAGARTTKGLVPGPSWLGTRPNELKRVYY
jgi:hypothetical protein